MLGELQVDSVRVRKEKAVPFLEKAQLLLQAKKLLRD